MRKLSVVLALFFFPLFSYAAVPDVTISEFELRAVIADREITVTIPIVNNRRRTADAQLIVELLDPQDNVVATVEDSHPLKPGRILRTLTLSKPDLKKFEDDTTVWYRVRYSLIATDIGMLKGTVALGAITPQMFDLTAAYPQRVLAGGIMQMRVHAANPVTHTPVAAVQISAKPDFTDPTSATGVTNSAGDALLKLRIPAAVTEDFAIDIVGRMHGLVRNQQIDVRLIEAGRIVINTDKLLYQPGQSLHARAMAFDDRSHAIADAPGTFTLRNPDNQIVFQDTVITNAFGIANIDWELPDSTTLGEYQLEFDFTGRERPEAGRSSVRVSRYDLPNFTVTAKPDRTYYLPGENAVVEMNASYLFGKALTAGSAKLVFRGEGHWDYQLRKSVEGKEITQTSALDPEGRAVFKIDLSSQHDEFKSTDYRRFQDLDYFAYVTDPTTGKTEQRRLKLRLTHSPIHVYIPAQQSIGGGRTNLFVSTYYADGIPAECSVDISEDPQFSSGGENETPQFLRTVKTNRFGIAKVSDLRLLNIDTQYHEHKLIFSAHDKQGRSVSYSETIYGGDAFVVVTTDKALYQPTDSITVRVHAPELTGHLIIEAIHDGKILWSDRIRLRDHRGFTTVPANLGVTGELTIAAYSMDHIKNDEYGSRDFAATRTVLFPQSTKLDVKVKTDHATYRPGDEVSALMNVTLPTGGASPTALGVVVVDKAVEERIRTDEDFGQGHYGFWDWSWWYQPTSVGGISRDDLNQIDLSRPLPDGLDPVSELLLNESSRWDGDVHIETNSEQENIERAFRFNITQRLASLRAVVDSHHAPSWQFPTSVAELDAILSSNHITLTEIKDPWDQPFRFTFGVDNRERYIKITSSGPDKRFDTDDDLNVPNLTFEYFSPVGALINRAFKETYAESGTYLLNLDKLRPALLSRGLDLDKLLDPWGHPYIFDFGISRSLYQLVVKTHGATPDGEPFPIWTSSTDYFADVRKSLDSTLAKYSSTTGKFPQTDAELDDALATTDNNFRSLRDLWGNSYYARYHIGSDFSDVEVFTYEPKKTDQSATPVTMKTAWIEIWSSGPDGQPRTSDDFDLASFSRLISQQSGKDIVPQIVNGEPNSGNTGAIQGIITDQVGEAITSATITATPESGGEIHTVESGGFGAYLIRNLAPGLYTLKAEKKGFRIATVKTVPVHSSSVTQVNVSLSVGAAMETVEVSAEAVENQTSSSSVSGIKSSLAGTKAQIKEETFTPRVRNFFPETLYWSPSVITDTRGHARLDFKLADNLTTWKMSVIASTKDGQIGTADTEFQSFQPFFAELDPPKILTVGDRIDLPVVVRNYLPTAQQVNVSMKPASWFDLQQVAKQQLTIPPGDSSTAIFPFRAVSTVKAGKQQVSAVNRQLGDAIEKPVSVHPDGLEQNVTTTDIVRGSQSLNFTVPANVIPGSLEGRLKVYPNLIAHVAESIEAGLHRPYGCGEQTISSTYPSVMLLQFEKTMGSKTSYSPKATHYLALGLRRLLSYRAPAGGFSYWGDSSHPDIALTAYAIRFLNDASQVTDVDRDLIIGAVKWLGAQQKPDGTWKTEYAYREKDGTLTAYVALTLSHLRATKDAALDKSIADGVHRAFLYLIDPHRPMNEPYVLAQVALLAHYIGEEKTATVILARLQALSIPDKIGAFWALDSNTAFYSWGHTGRIESTAVTLLALTTLDLHPSTEARKLIDAGTLFLLRQQDQYGVWYSGQATVNVLQALLAALGSGLKSSPTQLTLTVNGRSATELWLPGTQFAPTTVDLTQWLQAGNNEIKLSASDDASASTAQAVATYYIPWSSTDSATEKLRTGKSEALHLSVSYDRTNAKIGDDIKCTVNAERIGSRGWGMMIAEIGLPPGADVDRDSLNRVVSSSGWTISHYDILPDRLQVYLWPRAGGSKFEFTIRPRFGIHARTAPSQLYDYYNPEAEVSLAPTNFEVVAKP